MSIGPNETSIIVNESVKPTNALEAGDAPLLERLNLEISQTANAFDVDPSAVTDSDSWNGLSASTDVGASVYRTDFVIPENIDDISTTQNAAIASKNMTSLIASEKMRITALNDLYEELSNFKAKSSAKHSSKSTAARQEKLEMIQLAQKIERENANLLLLKRKAQASVLESDVILKNSIDAVNGKKTGIRSLDTFPEYLN